MKDFYFCISSVYIEHGVMYLSNSHFCPASQGSGYVSWVLHKQLLFWNNIQRLKPKNMLNPF